MLNKDGVESSLCEEHCFEQWGFPGVLGVVGRQYIERCEELVEWSFSDAEELANAEFVCAGEYLNQAKAEVIADVVACVIEAFSRLVGIESSGDNRPVVKLAAVQGGVFESEELLRQAVCYLKGKNSRYLNAINDRLNHLVLQLSITEKNNPFEPLIVVEGFLDACEKYLKADETARCLVLDQFRENMIEVLPMSYRDALDSLMDAGILPIEKNLSLGFYF